jgi:Ferric reductase NAD binding domain
MTDFGSEFFPYLWPVVAIWIFDRALRIFRIVSCNIRVVCRKDLNRSYAKACYIQYADVIRIEVPLTSATIKPGPGQHYFLYQPLTWRGWENHPFTLSGWQSQYTEVSSPMVIESPLEIDDKGKDFGETSREESRTSSTTGDEADGRLKERDLVFLVRPYDGWTRRLRDQCLKEVGNVCLERILIEGPYGHRAPFHKFDKVILIAGGSGITAALPYIQDHWQKTQSVDESTLNKTELQLIWTCKQSEFIRDVCEKELRLALLCDTVKASFYSTGSLNLSARSTQNASISYGRPPIMDLLAASVRDVQVNNLMAPRVGVLVCGPGGLADQTRAAVHHLLKEGYCTIEYFEEAFGW